MEPGRKSRSISVGDLNENYKEPRMPPSPTAEARQARAQPFPSDATPSSSSELFASSATLTRQSSSDELEEDAGIESKAAIAQPAAQQLPFANNNNNADSHTPLHMSSNKKNYFDNTTRLAPSPSKEQREDTMSPSPLQPKTPNDYHYFVPSQGGCLFSSFFLFPLLPCWLLLLFFLCSLCRCSSIATSGHAERTEF
jgi:hypothetical protein